MKFIDANFEPFVSVSAAPAPDDSQNPKRESSAPAAPDRTVSEFDREIISLQRTTLLPFAGRQLLIETVQFLLWANRENLRSEDVEQQRARLHQCAADLKAAIAAEVERGIWASTEHAVNCIFYPTHSIPTIFTADILNQARRELGI